MELKFSNLLIESFWPFQILLVTLYVSKICLWAIEDFEDKQLCSFAALPIKLSPRLTFALIDLHKRGEFEVKGVLNRTRKEKFQKNFQYKFNKTQSYGPLPIILGNTFVTPSRPVDFEPAIIYVCTCLHKVKFFRRNFSRKWFSEGKGENSFQNYWPRLPR